VRRFWRFGEYGFSVNGTPRAEFTALGRGALLARVALLQVAVIAVSALAARGWGEGAARAALLGGLNALAASAAFGAIALYFRRGRSQRAVLTAFFLGEAGKFLVVTAGFALIFYVAGPALSRADTLVLFGVFALTLGAHGAVSAVGAAAP
jgi:ATP synthase protein I